MVQDNNCIVPPYLRFKLDGYIIGRVCSYDPQVKGAGDGGCHVVDNFVVVERGGEGWPVGLGNF